MNHKQTVTAELDSGFISSPKKTKDGKKNQSYTNLTKTEIGDTIFSYAKLLAYNQFVCNDLTVIVKNELQNATPSGGEDSIDHLTDKICNKLQGKLETILGNTETKIMDLADKYETGDIQLANLNLKEKLIILFLSLKNLSGKSSRRNKSGEPLFSKMDLNDIAQILRLHFATYKGLKIDSIEKRIYEVNNNLKTEDPAYQDLNKALQKFFFNN